MSGVNLSDVILDSTNFWNVDLSGQDFSSVVLIRGTYFLEANLSNSNFEGVSLSPQSLWTTVFENKAYLIRDETEQLFAEDMQMLKEELFLPVSRIIVYSAEVRGNDLAVTWTFFNSFWGANLESANFKNASLWHANFYLADLTNADLSGADLSRAFLEGANLEGANLEGANLEGANLKCINHPICVSD